MEANSSNNPRYLEVRVPPAISLSQEKSCRVRSKAVRSKAVRFKALRLKDMSVDLFYSCDQW
jgi:hypothetical protein